MTSTVAMGVGNSPQMRGTSFRPVLDLRQDIGISLSGTLDVIMMLSIPVSERQFGNSSFKLSNPLDPCHMAKPCSAKSALLRPASLESASYTLLV
jgi:hypothetical protein